MHSKRCRGRENSTCKIPIVIYKIQKTGTYLRLNHSARRWLKDRRRDGALCAAHQHHPGRHCVDDCPRRRARNFRLFRPADAGVGGLMVQQLNRQW